MIKNIVFYAVVLGTLAVAVQATAYHFSSGGWIVLVIWAVVWFGLLVMSGNVARNRREREKELRNHMRMVAKEEIDKQGGQK